MFLTSNNVDLKKLRILQWNAKSVLFKYNELSKHCEKFNVILISDTWLSPYKCFMLKEYDTVREDRLDRSGGVLIKLKTKSSIGG